MVMGILNINNESFYSRSRHTALEDVDAALCKMVEDGADIIDIGACSTRPGSTPVSLEQEWEYLKEPLELIAGKYLHSGEHRELSGRKVQISIDTFRSEIVRRAYGLLGDFIVNDISAGEDDPLMLSTVGELGLPYIAMHKRGTPSTMQQMTDYPQGVVNAVVEYFREFEQRAAKYGIKEYVMDPGFGFAKNLEQNYLLFKAMPQLVDEIEEYAGKKRKLLVGISRKGMIWKPLGITPDEALCGTAALNLQALLLGADILRVHDVAEARQCIKLWELLR
jgi:dihydropteroate synthase